MDNNASNWNFNPLPEYPRAPLANPSIEAYQKRVQELTEEGNVLRYELNDMKGKYTSACSSYTHIAKELEKSRQQETSIGKMVLLFSDENERMKQELMDVTCCGAERKETWAVHDSIIKGAGVASTLLRYVLRHVLSAKVSSGAVLSFVLLF
ncbi:hypothetical protein Tco_1320830 [Tanacetum coccineum]